MNFNFIRGINIKPKNPIIATQQNLIYTSSGTLIVMDVQSKQQKILPIHDKDITAFDFNTKNGQVATGQEGTDDYKFKKAFIAIIDIREMKMVKYLMDLEFGIEDLKFSKCGQFLAVHAWDFQLIVYETQNYSRVLTVKQERLYPSIVWNWGIQEKQSDSFYLIESRKIRQFSINRNKDSFNESLQVLQNKELRNYNSPIYDDENKALIAGTAQGEIVLFMINNITQAIFKKVSQSPILSIVKFGQNIYCVTQNSQIIELKISQNGQINIVQEAQTKCQPLYVFCSNQKLYILSKEGMIFQIEKNIHQQKLVIQQPVQAVQDCSFDQKNQQIIQFTNQGYLDIYNRNAEKIQSFKNPQQHNALAQKMFYDQKENSLIVSYQNGDIYIFDKLDYTQKRFISTTHKGKIQNIFKNNKFLLTCCDQCLLRIWSAKNYKLVHEFNYHSKALTYCSAFGEESEMVISAGKDRQIIIFDLKREKKVRTFQIQNGYVQDILVLDNEKFISVGYNTPLCLWSINSNVPLKIIEDESKCLKIKISQSKDKFAVLTESGEIKVYKTNTLQKLSEIRVTYCKALDIFWMNQKEILFVEQSGAFGIVSVNQI